MRGSWRWTSLAAAWWLAQPVLAQAQVPQDLQSAEALAARIETAERSPTTAASLDEFLDLPTVAAELAKVRDYLSSNPEDAFALVLSVRLGRVHDLLVFRDAMGRAFSDSGASLPESPSFAGYLDILDGVLARDSSLAAAHYWKARVLVEETMRTAELGAAGAAQDSNAFIALHRQTLHHAGAAVTLAPDSVAYREFFALLLAGDGEVDAAAEALNHPRTAGTLLHLLVQDLQAFRPPPGAETDPVLENFVAMAGLMSAADSEEPTLAQYLDARLSAWSTSASLTDVEAHYRVQWPGVRFFDAEGWEGAMAAAFVPTPDGWHAVSDSVELQREAQGNGDVMLLLLPPEVVAQLGEAAVMQGVPEEMLRSGPRVGILYMNWRISDGSNVGKPVAEPNDSTDMPPLERRIF